MAGGGHTGGTVTAAKRNAYFAALDRGCSKRLACKIAGIGNTTARLLEQSMRESRTLPPVEKPGRKPKGYKRPRGAPGGSRSDPALPRPVPATMEPEVDANEYPYGPKPYDELTPEARKGLEDFGYFRRRYLGRGASEWQVEAAHQMLALLETPDREYAVVNVAPGVGKTTLFCHDLPAWLICRERRIRIMLGARIESQAEKYVNRLRMTLQRAHIVRPRESQLRRGLAVVPEASLVEDYGRFQGLNREIWTRSAFTVAQLKGEESTEKENTVQAFGQDSGVLGTRVDVAIWDDLVDTSNTRTAYSRETLINWWERESENRLDRDEGGLLILQGQRIDVNDLYRWALDQQAFDDDGEKQRKYIHIVFPAHLEDRCQGLHAEGSPSYPEGCLLDSHRLPWRELQAFQANNPDRYRILYQQEDTDPEDAMVRRLWVTGGKDAKTGEIFPGCWDEGRGLAEVPENLRGTVHSFATADPAPSRYWCVQWWLYEPTTKRRYLMDLVRTQMTAPMFLDWNHSENAFEGLMEDWHQRARRLGHPIEHWIVEHNAAQKFLFQYDHARRWIQSRGVSVIPHQTQAINKLDQTIGVTSIGPHYRFGRIRLPQGDGPLDPASIASNKLVNEAVGWPTYATDDCVMAQWFGECKIPILYPEREESVEQARPSWVAQGWRRG